MKEIVIAFIVTGGLIVITAILALAWPRSNFRPLALKALALLGLGGSALYTISPLDFIIDVPIIGWGDDLGVIIAAVLFARYAWKQHGMRAPLASPVSPATKEVNP